MKRSLPVAPRRQRRNSRAAIGNVRKLHQNSSKECPVAQDSTPEVSGPGDWKFGNTVKAAVDGAKAARAAGADIVVCVVQAEHSDDRGIMAGQACDVIVSGDDHDYMTGYDGITAYVETSTEATYLAPLDLAVTVTGPQEGTLMATTVIDYIAAAGKVDAKVEGRIVKQ